MKTAAVIAEYNPFHQGHRYHIEKTREITGADYVIAVMSGDFVQRGEPAVTDKYFRARAALLGGADLVIELPTVYATGSAQYFATGAVRLLEGLGCVDVLSFGSEWAGTALLTELARILEEEPEEYRQRLKKGLRDGLSFPLARQRALDGFFPKEEVSDLLTRPNHILALEYLRALLRDSASIEPLAIRRKGSAYHDTELRGAYSSASSIRAALLDGGDPKALREALGEYTDDILAHIAAGNTLSFEELMPCFRYAYLYNKKRTGNYFGMHLALARRLEGHYNADMDFSGLMQALHSKNMTDTAIKRALLHMVLQIEEAPYLGDSKEISAPYARILGFRRKAAPLLGRIRLRGALQVIQRPSRGREQLKGDPFALWLYRQDILSANLYEQLCAVKGGRSYVDEYQREQVLVEVS